MTETTRSQYSSTKGRGNMVEPSRHGLPCVVIRVTIWSRLQAFLDQPVQDLDPRLRVKTELVRIIHCDPLLPECCDWTGYKVVPAVGRANMIVDRAGFTLAAMLDEAPEILILVI